MTNIDQPNDQTDVEQLADAILSAVDLVMRGSP